MRIGGHSGQYNTPFVEVTDSNWKAEEVIKFCQEVGAVYDDEGECVVLNLRDDGEVGLIVEIYSFEALRRTERQRDKKRA